MFISYRVEDTRPTATWLFEKLAEAYGAERVFLDHQRLEGGAEWPDRLEAEARRAAVMLVLVGKGWLAARNPKTFARRLDQPGDWVRKEIETALDTGALVVPLLVEGAEPPGEEAFATVPSLAPLAARQALDLRSKDWAGDLERLHELLEANGFVRRWQPNAGSPDAGTATARPFTVPEPVADFTGREKEIAELEQALTSNGRAAICAVNGMGGLGKSQLAYELARRMAGHFPDGIVHLDLRGTADEPLASEAALAELVRAVRREAEPPAELARLKPLYLQAWRGRRALVLLDNATDERQVQDLVPPAPAALLVTSRRLIQLDGSRLLLRLGTMPEGEAIALLRDAIGTNRRITDAEAAQLARACGCLPLALRVAARFLQRRLAWTTAQYLAELRGRGVAALDKVGTVLGFSLDRLADEDGELARRFTLLGAFPAGFDADAVAAVWQVEQRTARDDLDALTDWSLVQVEAVGRYRLHDLVRDLAVARAAPAALEEARARHAGHYAGALGRAGNLYYSGGAGVLEGLALFDAERANVEAGQRWAVGNAGAREDAAALVARYGDAGTHVLHLRLAPRQRIAWLEAALAACQRLGDRQAEGHALGNLGTAWTELGEPKKAIFYFKQDLAVAREIGDRRGEGTTLNNLGNAWTELGETEEAIDFLEQAIVCYEQALEIALEIGDPHGAANAFGNLGLAWAALDEPEKAIGFYAQQLGIARAIGDQLGEANALWNSALSYEEIGERARALASAQAALAIYRAIESPVVTTVEAWLRERGVEF